MPKPKNSSPDSQIDDEQQPYETKTPSDIAIETAAKQLTRRQIIRDASEYVKKHISRQPPVQRFFSFMPTMLTRVSPFHFKGKLKSTDWPLVRLDSGDANSWGRMRVVGELLIIFDETVLFAILTLMTRKKRDSFETSRHEICRLTDVESTPSNSNAIWNSIRRLAGTRIDLDLVSGRGRKRKDLKELTGSILSFADIDRKTGSIRVVVNPYFLEMYAESFVTNIDLKFRSSLRADVSKAFYRFYQGQYETESNIEVIRLARAVNLDTNVEMRRLKDKIRTGLKELQDRRYLNNYQITRDNRVIVKKSKDSAAGFQSQILDPAKIADYSR